MPPTVFWPTALGLAVLALGLWTHRPELFDSTFDRHARIGAWGQVLIASAVAAFSGEHFTDAAELVQMVPKWLPLRIPITYLVGSGLFLAGVSIASKKAVPWSSALLALLFALFVALIYLPSAIRHPNLHIVWIFPFREGTYAMAAFSIFVAENQSARSGLFSWFVRYWAAFVALFYGVLNLAYPQFAPGVPSQVKTSPWVPFPTAIAYVTGAALVVLGVAALFRRMAVGAITLVGVLMMVLTVVLYAAALFFAHGPGQFVTAINFIADTALFAGSMFAIARAVGLQPVPERAIDLEFTRAAMVR